jgi:hypothetical protein
MLKKKVIFFLPYSLDKEFIKKFDIKNAKKFFNIKFFYLEKISQKYKKDSNFDLEKDLHALKKILINFKPEFGIMFGNDSFHNQTALFCKKFFNIKMIFQNTSLIPEDIIIRNKKMYFEFFFSKYLFLNFLYLISKFFIFSKQKKTKFNFDYSITSGSMGKKMEIVKNSKKIIRVCSDDYKKSFNFIVKNNNYAVFLDENLFYHRDYIRQGLKKKFVTKNYFNEMNNFFLFFEKKFNIKILIALHPKCQNKKIIKKLFNNRPCFIEKSHELVSRCKYVFVHPSTTAINIPIIYKKPVFFLMTEELMQNFLWKMRLERRKLFLNQPVINISDKSNFMHFVPTNNIDRQGYKKYLNYFIKSCSKKICDKSVWEEVNNSI